jgi:glycosyltransferase involved in cell wall biosynthesis/SAM-dependent methyltransferase
MNPQFKTDVPTEILTTDVADLDQEALNARAYWQKAGTHTMEYRSRSHYVDAILRFVTDSGARKILEFGCGSGRNLEQIHRELSGQNQDLPMHLRGIDTNSNSLEFGKKKFSSNLDLILGDEKALANEPIAYYDLVYTVSVLDHLPDPISVVRDLLSKTRRYAIFLEPVAPAGIDIDVKIERISTKWDPRKSNEATPFTYLHSYLSIFSELCANVIIDIPMPTSPYKLGPFYRLYLVEKNNFDNESACRVSNLAELSRRMTRDAILTLSSSLREELNKNAKYVKKVQSTEIAFQEAIKREERLVADKEGLQLERQRLEQALAQSSSTLVTMKDVLAETVAESQRLLALNETASRVGVLEAGNSLSSKLGEVLIQGWSSPRRIAPMLGELYNIWRKSKTQSPPSILGGDSFEKIILAYQEGGLSSVEKLLKEAEISSGIRGDAYTALARHLRKQHPVDAGESARRAYEADPRLFRRKWLVFRLSEANHLLESDALLATLPADTQFSVSENAAIDEIRGRADDERQIAARAKVDGYSHEIAINHQTRPVFKDTEATRTWLSRPDAYYVEKYRTQGVDAITNEISCVYADKREIGANECIRVAKALRDAGIPGAEYPLMKAAKELHARPATLRAFFWAAQREKEFTDACDAIHEIEQMLGSKISPDEAERLRRMKVSPAYQLTVLRSVEPKKPPILASVPNRICYVLHNSLPYSSGGYATRSHGVADGMIQAGLDVITLTRPGFPIDIKPELNPEEVALSEEIDGIRYMRILSPLRKDKSMLDYVLESADSLEDRLRQLKPEVVMAASNHVTGLPALIAARRLGLKFIYEVRGLWEITRMSREASFEDSAAFAVQSLLEAAVCMEADHVFTLTEPMREELITRGVEADKIDLLSNSCDPDRFLPREKDAELAKRFDIPAHVPVIGYVGTFVDYEGLEDLASACALLKKQGTEFRLLLVGNENASGQGRGGPISEEIINIADTNGFSGWLIMPGRVPHEEVESFYSLIDIAVFPRKPWTVCEMVSPMKPLEALAMEKAVLVSSVRALDEMIKHEETGLVFRKGDIDNLAETLLRLINNPNLRHALGKKGREWVSNERTWRKVGRKVGLVLKMGFIND